MKQRDETETKEKAENVVKLEKMLEGKKKKKMPDEIAEIHKEKCFSFHIITE